MSRQISLFYIFLLSISILVSNSEKINYDFKQEVKKIYDAVKNDSSILKGGSYNRLAELVDHFGPRLWGSPQLELFLLNLKQMSQELNISSRLEPVTNFTRWIRGTEELYLLSPRPFPSKLGLIGLGGTPSCHILAEALVVNGWDDLEQKKSEAKGKIVVFNVPWQNYSYNVQFRSAGAKIAKQYGAVATLVRSVASESIYSPHTGVHSFDYPDPICTAAITVEDAEMFGRMAERGQDIVLNLTLESKVVRGVNSHNFIAEIKGYDETKNHQIILFGGHVDSWDTGSQTGANDDGGGIITCFEALRVLKYLNLTAKRTLRVIGWSGEEWGQSLGVNGANQYYRDHFDQVEDHILAFESDLGSTKPYGFGFNGNDEATTIIKKLAQDNLEIINCTKILEGQGESADVEPFEQRGIPVMNNKIKDNESNDFYFRYHHSAGDSMLMMNPDDMDDNVIAIAAMMYMVAELDIDLPRNLK